MTRGRARSGVSDRKTGFSRSSRTSSTTAERSGQPPGLPHHDLFVDCFPRPHFRNARHGVYHEMLRPEKQDLDMFVAGVDDIVARPERVAQPISKMAAWRRHARH